MGKWIFIILLGSWYLIGAYKTIMNWFFDKDYDTDLFMGMNFALGLAILIILMVNFWNYNPF